MEDPMADGTGEVWSAAVRPLSMQEQDTFLSLVKNSSVSSYILTSEDDDDGPVIFSVCLICHPQIAYIFLRVMLDMQWVHQEVGRELFQLPIICLII